MKHAIYDWFGLNQTLFTQINHISNNFVCQYLSYIFSILFAIFVFLIYYFALVLYRYYRLRKSGFDYVQYSRYFDELLKIGACYAAIGLIYTLMKFCVNLPRPYCSLTEFVSIANFASERCLSSFPSAHTAVAVLIFYSLLPYLNFTGKLLGSAVIILVGLSRIALAMHFPADVLYSVMIAFCICYFIDKFLFFSWIRQYFISPVKKFIFEKICLD